MYLDTDVPADLAVQAPAWRPPVRRLVLATRFSVHPHRLPRFLIFVNIRPRGLWQHCSHVRDYAEPAGYASADVGVDPKAFANESQHSITQVTCDHGTALAIRARMSDKQPNNNPLATLAALQRAITDLQAQLGAAGAPTKLESQILALVKPGQVTTYADIIKATGLTKSVIHTAVQKLAYARKLRMALEPGPGRRLTYVLRRPEDVVVASELPQPTQSAPSQTARA